nr:hypothetical protein GCM10020092_004950 [Actinoplanes digitatis]
MAAIRSVFDGWVSQRDRCSSGSSPRIFASSSWRAATSAPKPPKMSSGAKPASQPHDTYAPK